MRICKALDLRNDPNKIERYKFFHTKEGIWPEVLPHLKEVGIEDLEIYLIENRVFMILEVDEAIFPKKSKEPLPKRIREWEEFVYENFQQSLPASSGEQWQAMEQIFSLKNCK